MAFWMQRTVNGMNEIKILKAFRRIFAEKKTGRQIKIHGLPLRTKMFGCFQHWAAHKVLH